MHFIKLSDEGSNYLFVALFSAIILTAVSTLFSGYIPYKAFELWTIKGTCEDWIFAGLPLLIWGSSVTIYMSVVTRNDADENDKAEKHFLAGSLMSVWAGVMEEICFRWLIFLSGIAIVKILNYLLFGWFFDLGFLKLLTLYFTGPISNILTLGQLSTILVDPNKWAIAASLLATNAFFRNGHKYQGWFGYINSWFVGMYLFWLMFEYGLLAAILVHFLYDFFIDIIRYIDRVAERFFARRLRARVRVRR